MLHSALLDSLGAMAQDPDVCKWWHHAALLCWHQGHLQLIPSRDGSALYLARFWLTQPQATDASDGSRFESGNSTLLHYFAQGDDDGALHDHPWNFTTSMLSGGYTERRPSELYLTYSAGEADRLIRPGCAWHACQRLVRGVGDPPLRRLATDQHAAEDVLPDTWTIVHTGRRQRAWGFHPPDRPWLPWADYLAERRIPSTPTSSIPNSLESP